VAGMRDLIQLHTFAGEPTTTGDITVTPQCKALSIHWPRGGLVWNRPVAVLVERDGQTRRVPIVDVTRAVQLALWGLSFVFWSVAMTRFTSRKGNPK
jgi:hypothetical protein